jgi:dipeptidyl aminopeptidase/acylaminoacyl peptidase
VNGREGVHDWNADAAGDVRTGYSYVDSSRTFRLLYRASGDGVFREIDSANSRKREGLLSPFLFLPSSSHALVIHDDDKGRSAIYETDLMTREDVREVFSAPEAHSEVSRAILSDDGSALLGVATTNAENGLHWIDPALAELQGQFNKAVPNRQVRITSFNSDRKKMLVSIRAADTPGAIYYYDVDDGRLNKIADMNSALGGRSLSPVKMVRYKSRDGLEIEAVLTMPRGAAAGKRPFIIMPHGGPWARDGLSYDYWAQFLAAKGYGVLQPNFRGSTGYGTAFLRAGEGQMGLAMQDDLTDGLRWAVKEGLADESKVCIVGASYGGYAAMWGVAKDPDLYRCSISIAGVASLRKEVNDFGDALFSGKYKDDWVRMTPDFAAVSPINAVSRIKVPMLLIHGRKDVTVDWDQSRNMFDKMKQAGKNVEFLPLPLADHYFTREADRAALLQAMGDFLDKHNPATPTP